ncbi:hypothetical protein SAMN06298214_0558 [Bacteroidales bacterium WCE2004]|nr:hypothetical protein SAMN06298214_0558 [Bacteroidales bacterium WCE2004]
MPPEGVAFSIGFRKNARYFASIAWQAVMAIIL